VEVREQQQLLISFLHHQAVQRKVHNPLEDSGGHHDALPGVGCACTSL
jgi:hypothetical protein